MIQEKAYLQYGSILIFLIVLIDYVCYVENFNKNWPAIHLVHMYIHTIAGRGLGFRLLIKVSPSGIGFRTFVYAEL